MMKVAFWQTAYACTHGLKAQATRAFAAFWNLDQNPTYVSAYHRALWRRFTRQPWLWAQPTS